MIQKTALILVYDQKSFLDHAVEKRMSLEMLCKIFYKSTRYSCHNARQQQPLQRSNGRGG